jgi:hypothetical protein
MFRKLLALLFLVAVCKTKSFSQKKDTIMLMNGQVVVERVVDTSFNSVTVFHPTKVKKKLHYDFEDVYGIFYADGNKKYIYVQDTARYLWFTRDEMFYFIKGEQDGRKGFKANGAMIGAGLLGFVGGATGSFFAPLAPYGFMAVSGVTKIRIKHKTISNPAYIDSDAYILGYERSARYKRKLKSVLGGTVGLALGYAFYFIFKDAYPTDYQNGKLIYK